LEKEKVDKSKEREAKKQRVMQEKLVEQEELRTYYNTVTDKAVATMTVKDLRAHLLVKHSIVTPKSKQGRKREHLVDMLNTANEKVTAALQAAEEARQMTMTAGERRTEGTLRRGGR
tara:strand:- start:59 stop:409 length:351 start_codon:yes stop_codon:yes gene_type:complete